MSYDLHIHTRFSKETDVRPEDIIKYAEEVGLEGIAITDHDTVKGVLYSFEAAQGRDLEIIPGIEIDFNYEGCSQGKKISFDGEVLGYFIDPYLEDFSKLEVSASLSRLENSSRIIRILYNSGFNINEQDVLSMSGKSDIVKRDICNYLVDTEQVDCLVDAFNLIGEKGIYNVKRKKISLDDAVDLIVRSKGVPIFAHGGITLDHCGISIEDFAKYAVPLLVDKGVKGFEIYPYEHVGKGYNALQTKMWNGFFEDINNIYSLISPVSGTDFHSFHGPIPIGKFTTSEEVLEQIREEHMKSE